MTFKEILQGKWLHHPLHPAVVHLPLGLWLGACVIDIAVRAGVDDPVLPDLALFAVVLGLAGAVIAAASGLADFSSIKRGRPARKLGVWHLSLNVVATVVWAVNLWLRIRSFDEPDPITGTILVLSMIGAVLLLVSGYLGSLLAFDHGTSVGRLSKKKWREIAKEGGARLPKQG